MSHANWLKGCVSPSEMQAKVEKTCEILKNHPEIIAIAVSGVSGCVFGGAVSFYSGLPLIIVRKDENTHSSNGVEMLQSLESVDGKYAIVDDLVYTGTTIKRIVKRVKANSELTLGTIIVYDQSNRPEKVKYDDTDFDSAAEIKNAEFYPIGAEEYVPWNS